MENGKVLSPIPEETTKSRVVDYTDDEEDISSHEPTKGGDQELNTLAKVSIADSRGEQEGESPDFAMHQVLSNGTSETEDGNSSPASSHENEPESDEYTNGVSEDIASDDFISTPKVQKEAHSYGAKVHEPPVDPLALLFGVFMLIFAVLLAREGGNISDPVVERILSSLEQYSPWENKGGVRIALGYNANLDLGRN